jgi:hypothetical protein
MVTPLKEFMIKTVRYNHSYTVLSQVFGLHSFVKYTKHIYLGLSNDLRVQKAGLET